MCIRCVYFALCTLFLPFYVRIKIPYSGNMGIKTPLYHVLACIELKVGFL